jgi:hypothetical protein
MNYRLTGGIKLRRRPTLLFSCASLALCVISPTLFGQQQARQNKAKLKARFWVKPAPRNHVQATANLMGTASASQSLPLWTFFTESSRDHNGYSGVMVGRDPFNGVGNAYAKTYIVPLIIKTKSIVTAINLDGSFQTKSGVTTFNPTVADRACLTAPNDVPIKVYEQSPIFKNSTFDFGGTVVGTTQYIDAFQKANFWEVDDHDAHYALLDPVITLPAVVINVPAASGAAIPASVFADFSVTSCAPLAVIDINWLDAYLDNTVLPALRCKCVNPSNFPVLPEYNVVESFGPPNLAQCCVLGYHGTTGFPIQTYSPVDFDSTGIFGVDFMDTYSASHEVAEWVDDPFGTNVTPPWGNVGQVTGCQADLEVADPLTGTTSLRIAGSNGFTYHLQELAFFSWFYGAPSIAIHHWYSNNVTFLKDAGPPCQ